MVLRASVSPRRAAAVLILVSVSVSLTISRAIADAGERAVITDEQSALDGFTRVPSNPVPHTRRYRVLFLGDSVMDQQGSAAAFLLRQAGVDAHAVGLWGSGLLTVDQYDNGRTKLSGMWFARARAELARRRPGLVGVYLNHNYWPPYPHDATGRTITDLWSSAGQRMIRQQAHAFITLLRAHGAQVFFVRPIPSGPNVIWHGYEPVLRAMHVPVADSAAPIANPDGSRAETKPSCDGSEQRVRPAGDLHLTRFGAGRAGTALATYVAQRLHVDLHGDAAPGDRAAALVPLADGRGYWLAGCDGSVYHFGAAPALPGARAEVAGHGGVVAAVRTPTGDGFWLVTADGTIAPVGDAPPLAFAHRPAASIIGASGLRDAIGLWAVTASGAVVSAGAADDYGQLPVGDSERVVGIAASPSGRGYLLATADGTVYAFGDARVDSSAAPVRLEAPIVGIAATADGAGYWLADAGGSLFTFGSARFRGTGRWERPPGPYGAVAPAPGPTVGVVGRPGSNAGYWLFGTTGRVVARGTARSYGGDNNLALFTP